MTSGLDCIELSKQFGQHKAVDRVSFQVKPGDFFSILGPSGCGKTTLLRMIAGFLKPDGGNILINSESIIDLPPNLRPVNMVFQHLALFPTMSVCDNIAYGLKRKKVKAHAISKKVEDILERIALPGIGQKKVSELSGGQRQRIAIARCLVLEPKLLLLDEPLGALDLKLREQMKVELKQLQDQFGTTFVYITHDQSEALVMSNSIAVMNQGKFEQIGSPTDLYHEPETGFVAHFVGESNQWEGQVNQLNQNSAQLTTAEGVHIHAPKTKLLQENSSASIYVRPEHMQVSNTQEDLSHVDNCIEGHVDSVLFNGANSQILIKSPLSKDSITVAMPNTGAMSQIKPDQHIFVGWQQQHTHVFPL